MFVICKNELCLSLGQELGQIFVWAVIPGSTMRELRGGIEKGDGL